MDFLLGALDYFTISSQENGIRTDEAEARTATEAILTLPTDLPVVVTAIIDNSRAPDSEQCSSSISPVLPVVVGSTRPSEIPNQPSQVPLENLLQSERSEDQNDIRTARVTKKGGVITILEADLPYGVVDGTYKFDRTKVGKGFRLAEKVNYVAERDTSTFEWTVTKMTNYVSEQDVQIADNSRHSTFTCQVLEIKEDSITASLPTHMDISIPKSDLPQHYKVLAGDFLEVKVELAGEPTASGSNGAEIGRCKFVSVEPSRTKTIYCGHVTSRNGALLIDEFVLITADLVELNAVKTGDVVGAVAVEFQQENVPFRWRAISVQPSEPLAVNGPVDRKKKSLLGDNLRTYVHELLDDKHGITIIPPTNIDFRKMQVGSTAEKVVDIANTSQTAQNLRNISIQSDQRVCKFTFIHPPREAPDVIAHIQPGKSVVIKITCEPLLVGRTRELLILDFGEFSIARYIHAKAYPLDTGIIDMLTRNRRQRGKRGGSKNQAAKKCAETFRNRQSVYGARAARRPFFLPVNLPIYPPPECVEKALDANNAKLLFDEFPALKVAHTEIKDKECLDLTYSNYQDMFHVALWFEEIEHQRKRDKFTLFDVVLFRAGDMMYFEDLGLQDIQPPLGLGEEVNICDAQNPEESVQKSQICRITGNRAYATFNQAFQEEYKGTPMTIRFLTPRNVYRRAHYAVDKSGEFLRESWLFPSSLEVKSPRITLIEEDGVVSESDPEENTSFSIHRRTKPRMRKSRPQVLDMRGRSMHPFGNELQDLEPEYDSTLQLKWFKQDLNEEQKNAVRRILRGQCRPLPFIIFGPPGTGKTVTLVEAIMQVHKLVKNSRILVTAPSNAAADLIAEYLVATGKFRPGDFVRLNGFQRDEAAIAPAILDFCFDGTHLKNIARNRIIISTNSTAGQLFSLGISPDHFTHVFVDEAGCSYEPDTLIAALFVSLERNGQFIMAGDPKQLGPCLNCDAAVFFGMEQSFLERLMKLPLYQKDKETNQYNEVMLTKLVKSYRSHELLLKLPSKLFYDEELIPSAQKTDTESLCHTLDFLPKRGVPLLFHGIRGDEAKDTDSPSWYNALEVLEVVNYLKKLIKNCCTADDIGIITPYRKQVEKIKEAISKELGCQLPKVGSVLEFQGGERKIMILSLVRSRDYEDVNACPVNKFEFLFSPKRFNVSVTRAKALLIVIGNPHLFCQSPVWHVFLEYCVELGVYLGCDLPDELNPTMRQALQDRPQNTIISLPRKDDLYFEGDSDISTTDSSDED